MSPLCNLYNTTVPFTNHIKIQLKQTFDCVINKQNMLSHFILLIILSLGSALRYGPGTIANGSLESSVLNHEEAGAISIGAVFDETSRPGKEARVAIEIVIHDFNSAGSNQNLQIYYGNSRGKPVRAAFAGKFICAFKFFRVFNSSVETTNLSMTPFTWNL